MDSNGLLTAIEAMIGKAFPGEPVYWDRLPKEFQRPSFTLECQKSEAADVSVGLVRRTCTVLVTCFAQADSYGDSSREELDRRMDAVSGLLGQGVAVGGRVLRATAVKGAGLPDCAEVQAVFSWVDARTGYQDPEDPAPGGGGPRMEHYGLDMSERKEG